MTPVECIIASKAHLERAAEIARALLQKDRLRIMERLGLVGAQTVTELYVHFRVEQSEISQHLKPLRQIGVVKATRQGKYTSYQIDEQHLDQILQVLEQLDPSEEDKAIINGDGAFAE